MTKSQRTATILGRLAGMAACIYFWFIFNDNGSDYPEHKSVLVSAMEHSNDAELYVLGIAIISTLVITLLAGFISRLLFSFGDDE